MGRSILAREWFPATAVSASKAKPSSWLGPALPFVTISDLTGVVCGRSSCDGGRCDLRGVLAELPATRVGLGLVRCRSVGMGGLDSSSSELSSALSDSSLPY